VCVCVCVCVSVCVCVCDRSVCYGSGTVDCGGGKCLDRLQISDSGEQIKAEQLHTCVCVCVCACPNEGTVLFFHVAY